MHLIGSGIGVAIYLHIYIYVQDADLPDLMFSYSSPPPQLVGDRHRLLIFPREEGELSFEWLQRSLLAG